MATQVFTKDGTLLMQRNATKFGPLLTVFSTCDDFFNSGNDSLERLDVELEDGRTMKAWEAFQALTRNGEVQATFKWRD